MTAEPKKSLSKTLTEHLTLTFHIFFLQVRKKFFQQLGEKVARGHSKSMFAQNFQFLTPRPLSPLFVLVRFSELPPPPSLKKSSTALMNFRMKNLGVKREKIIIFFVNSK